MPSFISLGHLGEVVDLGGGSLGAGRSEGGETVVRIYSMRLKYKVFMYKVQRTNLCFYRGLKQLLLMGERLTK